MGTAFRSGWWIVLRHKVSVWEWTDLRYYRVMSEAHDQLIQNLVSHVFHRDASSSLMEGGRFPANWASTYLALLDRASNVWREQPAWPREVVGAIHFASFYLPVRYDAWKGLSGAENVATEKTLRHIRLRSEWFLLAGVTDHHEVPSGGG